MSGLAFYKALAPYRGRYGARLADRFYGRGLHRYAIAAAFAVGAGVWPASVYAHGFAGERFFPAGLVTDDAFIADEVDYLGGYSETADGRGASVHDSSVAWELSIELDEDLQFSIGDHFDRITAAGQARREGWNNFEVGTKYQVFVDADAESAMSLGVNAEIGNTGSQAVSDSVFNYGPALVYEKGLGGLHEGWLRPLAFSVLIQPTIPNSSQGSRQVQFGASLQYSLPYLEDFVRDTDMAEPFRNMVLLVEAPVTQCLDNCSPGHRITGTVNPGVVWVGRQSQLGFELVYPLNQDSGKGIGFLFQYHMYLDDIFFNKRWP